MYGHDGSQDTVRRARPVRNKVNYPQIRPAYNPDSYRKSPVG